MKPFIRKEFKNRWEGRAPLSPRAVRLLAGRGIQVLAERSEHRCFNDTAYEDAGAILVDDDAEAELVMGIKEPKIGLVKSRQVHLCFSHTHKGQSYNMGLLKRFITEGCTLIDYEVMKDQNGTRTIAFGRYAGIAGAVDTFHVAGLKFRKKGRCSVLDHVCMTHNYQHIESLKQALGKLDAYEGEPPQVLITGTGNAGKGCVEVCEWLGLPRIDIDVVGTNAAPPGPWHAVAGTSDIVRKRDGGPFDKAEYRKYGLERYESDFDRFFGHFDILLQTPYWEEKYPSVLSVDTMRANEQKLPPVVGDISCDINGSIGCTLRESTIDEPAFTYNVARHEIVDGVSLDGPTVIAVGHLPCELSVDATYHFSSILVDKMEELTNIDLDKPLEECGLGRELREATIVYRGDLTPNFAYLREFLD